MSSTVRIVLTNGDSFKRKIIGQRLSWIIASGKHRTIYYPINQVRTINYRTVEDFGFDSSMEAFI